MLSFGELSSNSDGKDFSLLLEIEGHFADPLLILIV